MNRRSSFYTLVVLVGLLFATFQYGQVVGRAEERANLKAILEGVTQDTPLTVEFAKSGPPDELGSHRWTGRFEARIGGLTFDMTRYSMLDSAHDNREWASMACVSARKGIVDNNGRFDPNQWGIAAHDADHPFPSSIDIAVKEISFSPLAAK